ncbi:MAG: DUF504 domain-containing protein [Candidatus Thermoplasmatota archaeon]|nr:DUF504 domain-containing protein [Candidatus Thermoplasmatota archaeon]
MSKNIKNNPRLILNQIKWTEKFDLKKIIIYYLHRGAPGNTKSIYGKEIKLIGKSFIETYSAFIPYHRILKIEYDRRIIFDRFKFVY